MRTASKKVPATAEKRRKTVTVNAVRLTVRKEPKLNADVMRYVVRGEELEITGEGTEGWTKVKDGFVMSEFVS